MKQEIKESKFSKFFNWYIESDDSKGFPLLAAFILSITVLTVGYKYFIPIQANLNVGGTGEYIGNVILFTLDILIGILGAFAFSQIIFQSAITQANYLNTILKGRAISTLSSQERKTYYFYNTQRWILLVTIGMYEVVLTAMVSYIDVYTDELKLPKWLLFTNIEGQMDTFYHLYIAFSLFIVILLLVEQIIISKQIKQEDKIDLLDKKEEEINKIIDIQNEKISDILTQLKPVLNTDIPSHNKIIQTLKKLKNEN